MSWDYWEKYYWENAEIEAFQGCVIAFSSKHSLHASDLTALFWTSDDYIIGMNSAH